MKYSMKLIMMAFMIMLTGFSLFFFWNKLFYHLTNTVLNSESAPMIVFVLVVAVVNTLGCAFFMVNFSTEFARLNPGWMEKER